jgi:predicted nucleic acid-binding protein
VSGRFFLDTNVLVYADDLDAGEKREVAREILREALSSQTGVVSTQVLQEFFVIATRKLGVEAAIARRKVELLSSLDLVLVRLDLILGAIDLHRLHEISYWDALILKCASAAGCTRLISEKMHHGQVLDGVRIENPFLG